MRAVTNPGVLAEVRRAVGRGELATMEGKRGESAEVDGREAGLEGAEESAAADPEEMAEIVEMAEVEAEAAEMLQAEIEMGAELHAVAEATSCVDGASGADAGSSGAYRRARVRSALGQAALLRAVGPGWLDTNPLGGYLSETEAKLELDGQRVYRCLLQLSSH